MLFTFSYISYLSVITDLFVLDAPVYCAVQNSYIILTKNHITKNIQDFDKEYILLFSIAK